jgi:hypothetical protein
MSPEQVCIIFLIKKLELDHVPASFLFLFFCEECFEGKKERLAEVALLAHRIGARRQGDRLVSIKSTTHMEADASASRTSVSSSSSREWTRPSTTLSGQGHCQKKLQHLTWSATPLMGPSNTSSLVTSSSMQHTVVSSSTPL